MNTDHKYQDTSIRDIVWSSTAEKLAIVSGGTVTVLDPRTGETTFVQNYEVPVTGVSFFRDDLFAAAVGNKIIVWESDTWNEIVHLETPSRVTTLQFCCYDEIVCNQPLLVWGDENGTVTVFDFKHRTRTTKHLHNRPVKSVAWRGFRHTGIFSVDGDIIVESIFERCELTQANRRKAASDLLATPYQPSGGESLIHGDNKGAMYKNHRLDYTAIGASLVAANHRNIEYHIPQIGRLARGVGDCISSLSWVGRFPLNFVTGDRKAITIWGVEIVAKSFLTRWLSKSNVSGAIVQPLIKIEGHQDTVTALAYPSVKRAGQKNQLLLASGSADGTVKLWDVNNDDLRKRAAETAKPVIVTGSYAMVLNGTEPPKRNISVSPEFVLRRTFDFG